MNLVEKKKSKMFYFLMSIAAFLILLLPVGIANMVFGYILHDNPCILCWGQREAMIFIGVMALFIVRYGLEPKYIAALLIMSAVGLYQSFAHLGNHAHRDIGQGFGPMIGGIHTYGWAEFVFWFVIVALALLFALAPKFGVLEQDDQEEVKSVKMRKLNKPTKWIFVISAIIIASNSFQALTNTGVPPFLGQSDPVRFSLNPKEIIWSTEGWKGLWQNISFLGKRDVENPDFAFASDEKIKFDHNSAQSPFVNINQNLKIVNIKEINIQQPLNTLMYYSNEYVASSKFDVYFMNPEFKLQDHFKIDPFFSATIDPIVGITPYMDDKFVLMGSNKSFLRFMKNPNANPYVEYANFLEGANHFQAQGKNLGRGRIDTVRAKFHYIQSSISDGKYLYLASVPNQKDSKKFVISSVSLQDFVLSSEFTPKADLKADRTLGDLYITAMDYQKGKLYALSKNYNVIAVIDIASQSVVEVISYPQEITNARALILQKNGEMEILSYQEGKNKLFILK